MLTDLEKRYPEDTLVQELYVPQARAGLRSRAVTCSGLRLCWNGFEPTISFLLRLYLRGLAYLQLKDSRNAIASFQDATRLKGVRITLVARMRYRFSGWAAPMLWRAISLTQKRPTMSSLPSGRMPTLTCRSSLKQRRNTLSSSSPRTEV